MEAVKELPADLIHKETENYLAQIEKENEIIDKQVRELLGDIQYSEEDAIREYDLPLTHIVNKNFDAVRKENINSIEPTGKFNGQISEDDREQLYLNQIRYLESRLENSSQTIEILEAKLREKEIRMRELESKNGRSLSNFSASPSRDKEVPLAQTAFSASLKRKEREQEKKIQELESKLIDERKAMQRLHHLNKELLAKIKETQKKDEFIKTQVNKTQMKESKVRSIIEENQQLSFLSRQQQKKIHDLEEELEETKKIYQNLLNSSMEFEEKTRDLYRINQVLNENLKNFIES